MPARMSVLFALILAPCVLDAATDIFPLKKVEAGLKGEALTVFSGTKIQSFQFEVMGVAHDFIGPGRDVIWCRMTSDPTGSMVVAHGMSGSPCYVNGRLMGALAYGWEFSKEPVFGVQPIEGMLEVLRLKEAARGGSKGSGEATATPSGERLGRLKSLAGFARPNSSSTGKAAAQMLLPPLEISGLNPCIADRVLQAWSEAGFFPRAGGGGGVSRAADAAELVPGAAAAAIIAEGDLGIAATGTLTWRDGDRVVAFGHPLLGVGALEIPLGKAEIVGIVPSYASSMKMANRGSIVGRLTQDRLTAVGGALGGVPRLAPMSVRVKRGDSTRDWKLRFCDNKFFTPLVYQTALVQFLSGVLERSEESTVTLRSTIEFEGLPPLKFDDVFSGERYAWLVDAVMTPALQLLPVYENEFETPRVKAIHVEAAVETEVHLTTVEEMSVQPLEARAGETILVRAGLQRWHGPRVQREWEVKLPEEVKSGEVELVLADGSKADQLSGTLLGAGASRGAGPRDMKQLILALNKRHRHDSLYLVLQRKSAGLQVQDQRLVSLPESVRNLLSSDQSADRPAPIADAILSETAVEIGGVVEGSRSVRIKIK